jgi:GGDEF domain-containing protein
VAAWNEAPAAGGLGECAALVRSAEALRFSAPELAVQLARRALLVGAESTRAAEVDRAKTLSMRAQAVLASGLVRLSHYVEAVEPAFAALALAEGEGAADVAAAARLDLAACSREVGEPLLGCELLGPVLETAQLSAAIRAGALGRLVGCVAHVARRDDVEDALTEADRLLAADDGMNPDVRRLERARLSVRAAAYHRWYGDTEDAADAAREGITQLNRVRGLRPETARLRAQLVLELACALLDDGSLEEAASVSEAVLAEPVRATSAAAVGRLMLAVSTRVHLPSGRVDRGRGLLDQAVWVADRHGLDGLLADVLTAVSQLDEAAERTTEALESLRGARAAEQRRLRGMAQAARLLLTENSPAKWNPKSVNALLREVLRAAGHQPATKDWHLVAQRVTQPARQTAQPPAATSGDLTWPIEQAATGLEQYATTTSTSDELADAASVSDQPQAPEPTAHEQETAPETPTAQEQRAAPAQPAEHEQTAVPAEPERPAAHENALTTSADPAAARVDEQDETDAATGLLNKDGLIRRLRSVRNGERPVALALVRLDNYGATRVADPGPRPAEAADVELNELAGRVRDIAPENAELARSDGTELAVLLPHTTRDQAEKFAAAIESAWLGTANGHSISTGVVQSNPDARTVDARALINAARHALTPAVGAPGRPLPPPSSAAADLADMDPGDTLRIGRAIISSLSIPTGSGGKRRAAEDPADEPPPSPESEPGFVSSTYEQTKAELARLMSTLNEKKAPQAFQVTPLPAPSHPAEDRLRNGTALPSQSIPTPPDPDEVPDPAPHPDIPDPAEPTPIPPAPPEPGPEPQPDTGPLTPPGNETSGITKLPTRRRGASLPPGDSPVIPAKSGEESRSSRRRGGLAAAFGSRSEGDSTAAGLPRARRRMTLAAAFAADPDPEPPNADAQATDSTDHRTGRPTNQTPSRALDSPPAHRSPDDTADRAPGPSTTFTTDRPTHDPATFTADPAATPGHAANEPPGNALDDRATHWPADDASSGATNRNFLAEASTNRPSEEAPDHSAPGTADDAAERIAGHTTNEADHRSRVADPATNASAPTRHRPTEPTPIHAADWATDQTDRAANWTTSGTADRSPDATGHHTPDPGPDVTANRTTARAGDHAADSTPDRATDQTGNRESNHTADWATDQSRDREASRSLDWANDRAIDGSRDREASHHPDRATDRASDREASRSLDWASDRSGDREASGTADWATDRAGDREANHTTDWADRSADREASRTADWATDRASDREASRSLDWASDRSGDREASRTAWASDRSGDREANHTADRATGRASDREASRNLDWANDQAIDGSTDREASRHPDRATDRSGDRETGRSANRSADRTNDRSADRPADQTTDWATDATGQTGQSPARQVEDRPSGHSADRAGGRVADGFGGRATSRSAGSQGDQLRGRESRAERSSGSTTIAGLLAEALAAYQETSDEPDPQPRRPAQNSDDNEFDRLFDWRYQSPASGRHRSPE